ncbi:hypothetical protein [Specibacter cremeus]|uniref:hypothetical protein n=1 Tax=Specibacter cremeus TaxID=1629051 RepID=UPI000F7697D8|nr:hypothetical protein [Specibacter cremeus]
MVAFAVVIVVTTLTVAAIRFRLPHEHDPDGVFWYAFAGLCLVVPAIIITALAHPWVAAVLACVAAANAVLANIATGRLVGGRELRRAATAVTQQRSELVQRHDELLARWLVYETDPGRQIDFPAMTDVAVPATALLVKAMARAAELRRAVGDGERLPDAVVTYALAVAGLEDAFDAAERSARAISNP